jgi:hypothetical protein
MPEAQWCTPRSGIQSSGGKEKTFSQEQFTAKILQGNREITPPAGGGISKNFPDMRNRRRDAGESNRGFQSDPRKETADFSPLPLSPHSRNRFHLVGCDARQGWNSGPSGAWRVNEWVNAEWFRHSDSSNFAAIATGRDH